MGIPMMVVGILAAVEAGIQSDDQISFSESQEIQLAPAGLDGRPQLPRCKIYGLLEGQMYNDELEMRLDRYTSLATPCVPLAYTATGNTAAEESSNMALADRVAAHIGAGENPLGVRRFNTWVEVIEFTFNNPGVLDAVMVVTGATDGGIKYQLWKNTSAEEKAYPQDQDFFHYAHHQKAIEHAALKAGLGSGSTVAANAMKVTIRKLRELPSGRTQEERPVLRDQPWVVDVSAAPFMVFAFTIVATLVTQLIVQEKREGVLGLLRMTGLRESTYWISWFLILNVLYFFTGLFAACVMKATSIELFSECNFSVLLLANWLYLMATLSVMLVLSALVKEPRWLAAAQFLVVIGFMVFVMVLPIAARGGGSSPADFYSANALSRPDASAVVQLVTFFLPPFHYGKILNDIYSVTGTRGGWSAIQAEDPLFATRTPGSFTWDMHSQRTGFNSTVGFPACYQGLTEAFMFGCTGDQVEVRGPASCFANEPLTRQLLNETAPCGSAKLCSEPCDWWHKQRDIRVGSWKVTSISETFLCLMGLAAIYLLLAWYLAQIFSAGTGSAQRPWFPCLLNYWTGRGKASREAEGPSVAREQELSQQEGSIRLLKLTKSYGETTALRELTLAMQPDQIFCLLGQNGAGKTTTINVLTGLHPPTFGEAFMVGKSIQTEMDQIQSIMGCCPQDNVLFEALSGRAHMRFWGRFRGMSRAAVAKETEELLAGVALLDAAGRTATSYSGGMKRRLSVAMAYLAAPRIVFLDEPTTGLDPLSRMRTWESISRLKAGRVVCLTTHSMEEADGLGDKIGILATGRLRALGSPLYLKGTFGSGYHITLLCDKERSPDVLLMLKQYLPTAEVISDVAGHITVGVEHRMFPLVPSFFAEMERQKAAQMSPVREWGLSASTLEEVFLKVAVTDKSVNAQVEGKGARELALYPGLELNCIEGRPVHITFATADGQRTEAEHVISLVCGAPRSAAPAIAPAGGPAAELQPTQFTAPPEPEEGQNTAAAGGAREGGLHLVQNTRPALPVEQDPDTAAPVSGPSTAAPVGLVDQEEMNEGLAPPQPVLPAPEDGIRRPAAGWQQMRGLLLKNGSLMRSQLWPTGCRYFCVVLLIALSLFALMGLQPYYFGSEACAGGFHVYDNKLSLYMCSLNSVRNYLVDHQMTRCTHPRENEYQPPSFFQISPSQAGSNYFSATNVVCRDGGYNNGRWPYCESHFNCATSIRDPGNSERCDSTSNASASACMPAEVLPNFCSLGSLTGDSIDLAEVDMLQTLKLWHEGPLDPAWLGLGNADATVDSADWLGPVNANNKWHCGRIRVHLVEKSDVQADFLAAQEAQRANASGYRSLPSHCTYNRWAYESREYWPDWLRHPTVYIPSRDEGLRRLHERFPTLALKLRSGSGESRSVDYDILIYGTPYLLAARSYKDARVLRNMSQSQYSGCTLAEIVPTRPPAIHTLVNTFTNGLLGKMWSAGGHSGPSPRVEAEIVPMLHFDFPRTGGRPYEDTQRTRIVVASLCPVSMMFFPVLVLAVQQEKTERCVLAMQLQSLRIICYWLATYLWNTLLYWSAVGFYWLCAAASNLGVFGLVSNSDVALIFFLWGHAQIALGIFLAAVLGRSRLTSLLCYVTIVSTIIAGTTVSSLPEVFSSRWPTVVFFVPMMNFVRSLILVLEQAGRPKSDVVASEFSEAQWIQLAVGTALLVLGITFHSFVVNDVAGGQLLSSLLACCRGRRRLASKKEQSLQGPLDDDVQAEATRVEAADPQSSTDLVRVKQLVKEYSSGFVAVKGVSFGVASGECFGLLGPNGAGKTTVISMLSGSQQITGGEASICGMDVRKDVAKIFQVLGIVPQFDVTWPELKVIDHLLLFARIKGLPRNRERALARSVAEAVGLDGDPLRQAAKKLSGGMRRRLSLGIALVTNPRVVFLDEPSTGLDPETRQSLWRSVSSFRQGRSVILTTHSMEEADALCDRIGIMATGSLRCMGTPLHLKGKFGRGYHLTVQLKTSRGRGVTPQQTEAVDRLVRSQVSTGANLMPSFKGEHVRTYLLPPEGLQVSKVFEALSDDVQKRHDILEWSLNQTSLNEVFLRIATEAEAAP